MEKPKKEKIEIATSKEVDIKLTWDIWWDNPLWERLGPAHFRALTAPDSHCHFFFFLFSLCQQALDSFKKFDFDFSPQMVAFESIKVIFYVGVYYI